MQGSIGCHVSNLNIYDYCDGSISCPEARAASIGMVTHTLFLGEGFTNDELDRVCKQIEASGG